MRKAVGCCLVPVFAVLIVASLVWFCAPQLLWLHDYEVGLPGGYQLWQISGDDVCIVRKGSDRDVLECRVDGYRVYSGLIVGHISKSPGHNSVPGYFILDVRTHKVLKGLDQGQWTRLLHTYGVQRLPILHKPTGLDALRGYNRPSPP